MAITHASRVPRRLRGDDPAAEHHVRIRRAASAAAAALVVAAVGGCAYPSEQSAVSGKGSEQTSQWNNPIGGVAVRSVRVADKRMPFTVRVLPLHPGPYRILVTPRRAHQLMAVVLQYRTAYGLIDVAEGLQQITAPKFRLMVRQWVALNGKPGTSGTSTAVTLNGSIPALMTASADGRTAAILWVESGVEYNITGPKLSKEACIHLGNLLASHQ